MYRTIVQLDALTAQLANQFPQYFSRIQLPNASVEGRPIHALRMRAGQGDGRRGVLIVGGTHARELMNPDAIVEMAVDLLVSHANGSDIVYGGRIWPANEVRSILETLDLWLLPCLNPDGRHHVMTADDLWRKNRRDNPGTGCDGVDLNRNVDFLWGVTEGQTSCSPCSEVFCGSSAFSEPETRNVKDLLDGQPIDCFADVHSYSELILHPWGHAGTQTVDETKRFTGLPSGTCAPLGQPGYEEFMTPQDLLRLETVGQRIVDAISAVRGRVYSRQTGIGLYPTTGTHSDYVYSRHIADPSLHKTYGYTFETGPWLGDVRESFHPADPTLIKTDAKSGMLALAQQCICAIEVIRTHVLERDAEIATLRRLRDDLGSSEAGRAWIALLEAVQSPVTAILLADEGLLAEAGALVETAARLVEDEDSLVSEDDVNRGRSLIRDLSEQSGDDKVQADLEVIGGRLAASVGVSSREAIEALKRRGPSD